MTAEELAMGYILAIQDINLKQLEGQWDLNRKVFDLRFIVDDIQRTFWDLTKFDIWMEDILLTWNF